MPSSVGNLFGKYSATYSKAGEAEGRLPLGSKELRKASRNELRGFDGEGLRVSKRGGNFLDRVMCWLEDRVFSLTRSGSRESSRQKHSHEFSDDVKAALSEIDVSGSGGNIENHELMKRIESVRKRDLPLRSGFVQSILREVASQVQASGKDGLPDIANRAFPANGDAVRSKTPELDVSLLFSSPKKAKKREAIGVFHSPEGEDQDDSIEISHSYSARNLQPEPGRAEADNLSSMNNGMFFGRLSDHVEEIVQPYIVAETRKISGQTSMNLNAEIDDARDSEPIAKVLTGRLARESFKSIDVSDFRVPLQQRAQQIYNRLVQGGNVESIVKRETRALHELAREISAGHEGLIETYVTDQLNPGTDADSDSVTDSITDSGVSGKNV